MAKRKAEEINENDLPKKRGRPPKTESDNSCASWDEEDTADFLKLRFETMKNRFDNAKNNREVNEAWVLLSCQLTLNRRRKFTEEQCRSKLKNLKTTYYAYQKEKQKTGNEEMEEEETASLKPSIQLLFDYFGEKPGMTRDPIVSSDPTTTSDTVKEEKFIDLSSPEIKKDTFCSKRLFSGSTPRKTHGEYVESGLKVVSEGLKEGLMCIGNAMSQPTQINSNNEILKALEKQSNLLETLILHLSSN